MGSGFYGRNFYGGGSWSSELPALAPQFTDNRPANPSVDFGEALNRLEVNAFNSPEHYHPPRMNLCSIPPPPFVSPHLYLPVFNESSSRLNHAALYYNDGLWDREIIEPIQFGVDLSLPSSSAHIGTCSLGPLALERSKTPGWEDQVVPPTYMDYNTGLRHNPSSMPVNYMDAPVVSSSLLPETDLCVPPMNLVNCKMNQSILFGETSATMAEKFSSKMALEDANKHLFREKFGISFADVSPDAVEKALDSHDLALAEEKFLESCHQHNKDVELPCWKGSYDSPLQSYVPVPVSNSKESKVFPMKFSDVLKLPPRKPGEIKMTAENGIVGDDPVSIMFSGEHQLDATAGSYHEKTISGKESVSGCSASLLIDAMHNLSKFLLNHCSNGTCELSERDVTSLEEVISNLDKCISTNIGQELHSDLRLDINMGCLQSEAIAAPCQKPQEKRKLSDEKDESVSAVVSVKSGSDTEVKMDKKTQDAALCLAWFHNLEIGMEKSLSDNETGALDDDEKSSIIDSDEDSSSKLDDVDKLATEANDSPISGQSPQDMLANDAEERLDIKDFHLCSEHVGMTESPGMTSNEHGFSASWDDDSSLDWEHVSMEELSELNSSS